LWNYRIYRILIRLQAVVEILANDMGESLRLLATEQQALWKMTVQNRLALDIVLASKGGVCGLIDQECCSKERNRKRGILITFPIQLRSPIAASWKYDTCELSKLELVSQIKMKILPINLTSDLKAGFFPVEKNKMTT
uniref:ERVV2 protein n=1 Tax=Chelydra serpentina TaxID=8475 RepID=A0A8C3T180_CHESE